MPDHSSVQSFLLISKPPLAQLKGIGHIFPFYLFSLFNIHYRAKDYLEPSNNSRVSHSSVLLSMCTHPLVIYVHKVPELALIFAVTL